MLGQPHMIRYRELQPWWYPRRIPHYKKCANFYESVTIFALINGLAKCRRVLHHLLLYTYNRLYPFIINSHQIISASQIMESNDNSTSSNEQSPSQFCQEVGSNSINSFMDNTNSGNNGDCLKCSIC